MADVRPSYIEEREKYINRKLPELPDWARNEIERLRRRIAVLEREGELIRDFDWSAVTVGDDASGRNRWLYITSDNRLVELAMVCNGDKVAVLRPKQRRQEQQQQPESKAVS